MYPNDIGQVNIYPWECKDKLTENFSVHEFRDSNVFYRNHFTLIHPSLIVLMQRVRDDIGKPITVLSGYRTEKHNERVGGAPKSYHTIGYAADWTADIDLEAWWDTMTCFRNDKVRYDLLGGGAYYPDHKYIHVDVRGKPGDKLVTWSGG